MSPNGSEPYGFIIMPFLDDLVWLHETIVKAGVSAGVRLERADDIFEPGVVLDQIRDAIDRSDAIVAVCTGRNANVFFEMGLAWREHRPILVAEGDQDLPFDVAHYRTALYGSETPGKDRASLAERLTRLLDSTLADERLPRGRRIGQISTKPTARLSARFEKHGKHERLVLANTGSVELFEIDVKIPPEGSGLNLITSDLPLTILRPGDRIPLPAIIGGFGGDGKSIFDVVVRGKTPDGEVIEQPSTISLY